MITRDEWAERPLEIRKVAAEGFCRGWAAAPGASAIGIDDWTVRQAFALDLPDTPPAQDSRVAYWQQCPICYGKGIVPGGFYETLPGCDGGLATTVTEKCRQCDGKGILLAALGGERG